MSKPDTLRGCASALTGMAVGVLLTGLTCAGVILATYPDDTKYDCFEDEVHVTVGDEQWCVAIDDLRKGEQRP